MARLTDLMVQLYRRLNGREPSPDTVEVIETLRDDYDLDDDSVPPWLVDAFNAAMEGKALGRVDFQEEGDVAAFLLEAARKVPGWEHDEQGEYLAMRFPALGTRVVINREGLSPQGTHCCFVRVERLP